MCLQISKYLPIELKKICFRGAFHLYLNVNAKRVLLTFESTLRCRVVIEAVSYQSNDVFCFFEVMADSEDLGLGSEDQIDSLEDTNGINDDNLLNDTDVDGGGGDDPELEAIKARVREMEEEAEKLKQLQNEVDKQMNMGSPPGISK